MDFKPIIIALDFADQNKAFHLIDQLDPADCRLKIGKEMYTAFGPDFLKAVQARGFDVFLDLKFHDIPNTVARACKIAADLGVWMVNVHAQGGRKMMEAAREALFAYGKERPLLIAVTLLTSFQKEDLLELGLNGEPIAWVKRYAILSQSIGLDGIVSSAQDLPLVKPALKAPFLYVTPGIRLGTEKKDDQKRIMMPKEAILAGSDYLVIGRPITEAADPLSVLKQIQSQC